MLPPKHQDMESEISGVTFLVAWWVCVREHSWLLYSLFHYKDSIQHTLIKFHDIYKFLVPQNLSLAQNADGVGNP